MRLTSILLRQNIGKHLKLKWRTMKHRTVHNDGLIDNLKAAGIKIEDAKAVGVIPPIEIP